MKRPKKTTKAATKTKPKSFWRPRCPECNGTDFMIVPARVPTLHRTYLDNGDVVMRVDDWCDDDGDALTCNNCGKETTWDQCDHRRNPT